MKVGWSTVQACAVGNTLVSLVSSLNFPPSFLQQNGRSTGGSSDSDARVALDAASASTDEDELTLFPMVQELFTEGSCCARLSPDLTIAMDPSNTSPSLLLESAIARAQHRLRHIVLTRNTAHTVSGGANYWPVERVSIRVADVDSGETLDEKTNYHYTLDCSAAVRECTISAESAYAAISALESTLLQVFSKGHASFQKLRIRDWPDYQVRGLMVDLGRRFVPKDALLNEVINGMALVRMNLLQLHLSDFCRFALALPSFPELSHEGMLDGQYSVDDVREIVAYARDRGIRVVPEIDLPGHAAALLPLKARGLHFCEPTKGGDTLPEEAAKVFDDERGESRNVLRKLFEETAAAFGSEGWFHVGGDEVSPSGACTKDNIVKLENFLSRDLVEGSLGRTAIGWEEVLLKENRLDGDHAAGDTNRSIIVTWKGEGDVREVLQRGHRVIAASISHHYLDTDSRDRPISNFWYDLRMYYGVSPPEQAGLLGGISAMWTDRYCYAYQCEAAGVDIARRVGSHTIPVVPTMFARKYDTVFAQSLAGMIWPRAGVSAAALWHYSSEISELDLRRHSEWLSEFLNRVGKVASCPSGCSCDEASSCGRKYAPEIEGVLQSTHNSGQSIPSSTPWTIAAAAATIASKVSSVFLSIVSTVMHTSTNLHVQKKGTPAVAIQGKGHVVRRSSRPTIDTYVINLDQRKDRCACMASQLAAAPQAVYRQAALPEQACDLRNDWDTMYGTRNHTSEKSLFCTNYHIWQRAQKGDAEFVLVMEDDTILAPHFWSAVENFTQGCHFDYVTVDSRKAGGDPSEDRVLSCAASSHVPSLAEIFRPNPNKYLDYWGTQVQIIRKTYLDTLIQRADAHGMGPMDVWWMMRINDGTAFSWQPGIALQVDNPSVNVPELTHTHSCTPGVGVSDIAYVQRSSKQAPRFECP